MSFPNVVQVTDKLQISRVTPILRSTPLLTLWGLRSNGCSFHPMNANVRLSWKERGLLLTPYIDPDLLIYPGCEPRVSIRPQELPSVLPPSYGRLNLCRFLESVIIWISRSSKLPFRALSVHGPCGTQNSICSRDPLRMYSLLLVNLFDHLALPNSITILLLSE